MLSFELALIQKAPLKIKNFIYKNLFQKNKNNNGQNTAQGLDYKLEEYNKLFKSFEISVLPSIDDWTKIASAAPYFQELMEKQSNDYDLGFGLYSEPGAPDYKARVEACRAEIRKSEILESQNVSKLKNLDGKFLEVKETLNYFEEYEKRRKAYLKNVSENHSYINAELQFNATTFTMK